MQDSRESASTWYAPLNGPPPPPPSRFVFFISIALPLCSLQVSSLRRQQGGAAAPPTAGGAGAAEAAETSATSWDTPAARELRAKVKSLEKEARKREVVLQVTDGVGKVDVLYLHRRCFLFSVERGGGQKLCV